MHFCDFRAFFWGLKPRETWFSARVIGTRTSTDMIFWLCRRDVRELAWSALFRIMAVFIESKRFLSILRCTWRLHRKCAFPHSFRIRHNDKYFVELNAKQTRRYAHALYTRNDDLKRITFHQQNSQDQELRGWYVGKWRGRGRSEARFSSKLFLATLASLHFKFCFGAYSSSFTLPPFKK